MKLNAALKSLPRVGTRRGGVGFIGLAPFLAIAALLGPGGGGFRAVADFDTPPGPKDDSTFSMGVFQVIVDPNFYFLMDQGTFALPYPGWTASAHTLTSPVLIDFNTQIAESQANPRPQAFPVQVGFAAPTDLIIDYTDYLQWPDAGLGWDFQLAPINTREVLTEIRSFNLTVSSQCYSNTDPRTPSNIPFGSKMVRAGYANTFNGPGGAAIPDYLRPSIGMVQSQSASGIPANDFPANSFFDIYAEVTLPYIPSTPGSVFPLAGAVLTNGDFDIGGGMFIAAPLIVESLSLPGPTLPPSVVYTHTPSSGDEPFAVPLNFRDPNPPYWSAGDTFGTIVLAGHGTIDPCAKAQNVSNFLNAVLGPPGQLAPRAVVGRIFPDTLFPNAGATYSSAKGTNFSGRSLDAVRFTNGTTILSARSFNIANLTNQIDLPPDNSSARYTNVGAVLTFELSTDAINFIPAQATGTVQIVITNNSATTSATTIYSTELISFNTVGSSALGSLRLRESTTKASPGKHIVQTAPAGYRIGGYFDTSFEYSFNNGATYKAADRPIRLQLTPVDCGTSSPSLSISLVNSVVRVSWANGAFRLQGRATLSPTDSWVNIAVVSPYLFSNPGPYSFFRLVCP